MRRIVLFASTSAAAIVFASYFVLSSCVSTPSGEGHVLTDLSLLTSKPGQSFWVLSYNVENLFDIEDDPDKDDQAYLPLEKKQTEAHQTLCKKVPQRKWREECLYQDWNQKNLDFKLEQLTKVLKAVNEGNGPEVVLLGEIENKNVLEKWRAGYLSGMEYSIVHIEGPDRRGIDNAMLTRFPVKHAKLHSIEIPKSLREKSTRGELYPLRGILQVDLSLPTGEDLTVFLVHFPNPQHKKALRLLAIERLNQLIGTLPAERLYIAGGDFNISADEEARVGHYKKLNEKYLVSHLVTKLAYPGTNYYAPKRSWSYLDALVFSKSLSPESKSRWHVELDTIQTLKVGKFQVDSEGKPSRLVIGPEPFGVSDHLPLIVRLQKKNEVDQSGRSHSP